MGGSKTPSTPPQAQSQVPMNESAPLTSSVPVTAMPQSQPQYSAQNNSLASMLAGAPLKQSVNRQTPSGGPFNPSVAMELLKRGGY